MKRGTRAENAARFTSQCCGAEIVLGSGRVWWCTGCFGDVPAPPPAAPVVSAPRHGEQRNWQLVTDRSAPVELEVVGGPKFSMSMSSHSFSRVERFCGHGCGWVVCDGILGALACPGCSRMWHEEPAS